MATVNLTPAEVIEICSAGLQEWNKLGPCQSRAIFTWRGKRYVATHTTFRLCVDTIDRKPVACRYD